MAFDFLGVGPPPRGWAQGQAQAQPVLTEKEKLCGHDPTTLGIGPRHNLKRNFRAKLSADASAEVLMSSLRICEQFTAASGLRNLSAFGNPRGSCC